MTDEEMLAEAKRCAEEAGWPDEMYIGLMTAAIRVEALRARASITRTTGDGDGNNG